jgi:hypothetical protein
MIMVRLDTSFSPIWLKFTAFQSIKSRDRGCNAGLDPTDDNGTRGLCEAY